MRIRTFSFALSILMAFTAQAQNLSARSSAKSKAEFCEGRKDVQYFTGLAHNSENLMAFENHGGLFNAGVCWWHSLFQRSALYLTVYRPELKKPDAALAKKLIYSIAAGKRVVEIPGYANFRDFSQDWEKQIQSQLESWQLVDGALKWAWIEGLSGSPTANPSVIAKTLNFVLTQTLSAGNLEYTMWQFPGVTAHASINVGGSRVAGAYGIDHIDSNFPQDVRRYTWAAPARSINDPPYDQNFVPYSYRRSDLVDFKKAADQYCSNRSYKFDFFEEKLKNSLD